MGPKRGTSRDADASRERAALSGRVAALDWAGMHADLDAQGYATTPVLLRAPACKHLIALYDSASCFRSRVVMQRHAFGAGEYQYFAYPLPPVVETLRTAMYPQLARIANGWAEQLGDVRRFPPEHDRFLQQCADAGQDKPTPLMLKYGQGDYNRLHRDLYGDVAFPLQATILLSRPGEDFDGGEFILVEQAPRKQSKAEIAPLSRGQAVIFPVVHHPVAGSRGYYRAGMRHGVSRVRAGTRFTLGLIFHDAA